MREAFAKKGLLSPPPGERLQTAPVNDSRKKGLFTAVHWSPGSPFLGRKGTFRTLQEAHSRLFETI